MPVVALLSYSLTVQAFVVSNTHPSLQLRPTDDHSRLLHNHKWSLAPLQLTNRHRAITTGVTIDGKRTVDVLFTTGSPAEMPSLSEINRMTTIFDLLRTTWWFKHVFVIMLQARVMWGQIIRPLQPHKPVMPVVAGLVPIKDNYIKSYVKILGRAKRSLLNCACDYVNTMQRSDSTFRSSGESEPERKIREKGLVGIALRSYMMRTSLKKKTLRRRVVGIAVGLFRL